MRRRLLLAAACVAATMVTATLGSSGSEAAATHPETGHATSAGYAARSALGHTRQDPVARRLTAMLARGASDAAIERALPLVAIHDGDRTTAQDGTVASRKRWDTDRSTNASEMTYTNKRVFHYEGDALHVYAGLTWNMPDSPVEGDPGGTDGFGIRVSRNVVNKGGSLRICGWELDSRDNEYDCFNATNFWDTNERGVAWRFQDKEYWARGMQPPNEDMGFNWAQGTALFEFRLQSKACTQAFARYDHTWEDAEITSYSISNNGFSVNVSNVSHSWNKAANVDKIYCG